MTKQDFESKMAQARAMHGLSDRPYYYEGVVCAASGVHTTVRPSVRMSNTNSGSP